MIKRIVTIKLKAPGRDTVWLDAGDGISVVASESNFLRIAEYPETGKLPKPLRSAGRPRKVRPDDYIALHYYLRIHNAKLFIRDARLRRKESSSESAIQGVMATWRISRERVRAARRAHGIAAKKFIADQPRTMARQEWGAMLARVMAYGVEYVEDLASQDKKTAVKD